MKSKTPIEKRLHARLKRMPGGCLEWQGARDKDGYGKISGSGGKAEGMVLTHRVAYEEAYGPIPNDRCVLHTCDNPPCCELTHLWLGDRADNNADMVAKGRHGRQKGRIRFC